MLSQAEIEAKVREVQQFFEQEIWPHIPDVRGKGISKQEREAILGIGLDGCCESNETDFSLTDIPSA